jgi:hypothetical protein
MALGTQSAMLNQLRKAQGETDQRLEQFLAAQQPHRRAPRAGWPSHRPGSRTVLMSTRRQRVPGSVRSSGRLPSTLVGLGTALTCDHRTGSDPGGRNGPPSWNGGPEGPGSDCQQPDPAPQRFADVRRTGPGPDIDRPSGRVEGRHRLAMADLAKWARGEATRRRASRIQSAGPAPVRRDGSCELDPRVHERRAASALSRGDPTRARDPGARV